MRALRFLYSFVAMTVAHGGRIIIAAYRGVRQVPGGVYDRGARNWGLGMLRINRLSATVQGLEHVRNLPSCVYISNHVSFADTWALLAVLPDTVRFVYKKELNRIPVFGKALQSAGHVTIDRKNLSSAFDAYEQAAEAVRQGTSVIVFAEGTRSGDGQLKRFKKGPFVLAIAAQVPVVPVYVEGTRHVLPKGSISPKDGPITVHLGEPIPTRGLSYSDRDDLSDRCWDAVAGMAGGDRPTDKTD